jgi:hypothetical protein
MRRPPRPRGPTLLAVPNRERIESLFRRTCLVPHTLIAMELEIRPTVRVGDIAVLIVFVRELGNVAAEHVMPKEFNERHLEGGAEILGQNVARAIRKKQEAEHGRRQRVA